jgi:hypothetical protein
VHELASQGASMLTFRDVDQWRQSCRHDFDFLILTKRFAPQPPTHHSHNNAQESEGHSKNSLGLRVAANNHTSVDGVFYGSFADILSFAGF